jgi:transcriptional regulator with XRE-family HTH domain
MDLKKKKAIPKPTSFGANLKLLRRISGMSQTELAQKLSLTRNNIASYESGLVEPNAKTFLAVCAYFEVTPEDMLEVIMSKKPVANVIDLSDDMDTMDKFLVDQFDEFVTQTNDMTKVLEGYQTLLELRLESDNDHSAKEFYVSFDDLLQLLRTLIKTNWDLVEKIIPSPTHEKTQYERD